MALTLVEEWEFFPPLHPSRPVQPDEKAHIVLVWGTKGTVLFSGSDNLIPFKCTANLN